MIRDIVYIDENKCNGCGNCVPNCHEGALRIIDGKAVLVSDLMCDGLGACIGHCPEGALTIEKKEAGPYNETLVMEQMVKKGKNVVIAHLKHLKDHGEKEFLNEGMNYLRNNRESLSFKPEEIVDAVHDLKPLTITGPAVHASHGGHGHSCPGSASRTFGNAIPGNSIPPDAIPSALTHWPVQLHLINPASVHFRDADLLVAADCTAFSNGDFHRRFLKNKKLIIACPKLDKGLDVYLSKLISLITDSRIQSITVLRMEVPCCGGLLQLVRQAVEMSGVDLPVQEVVLSIQGEIIN